MTVFTYGEDSSDMSTPSGSEKNGQKMMAEQLK